MKRYFFNQYQKDSKKTAGYKDIGYRIVYPTLGLAGETGEVIEKIKKIVRDKQGKVSEEDKELLTLELGDVLWYLTQIASDLGIELEDIAKKNIKKLYSRFDRKALGGSGDLR